MSKLQVLDKLLPPPGEGIDDEIAVGKFYATVLIQVGLQTEIYEFRVYMAILSLL